jgi:hypothetical protein
MAVIPLEMSTYLMILDRLAKSEELVNKLSQYDPIVDTSEVGLGDCFYCLCSMQKGETHKPSCLWLQAKEIINKI